MPYEVVHSFITTGITGLSAAPSTTQHAPVTAMMRSLSHFGRLVMSTSPKISPRIVVAMVGMVQITVPQPSAWARPRIARSVASTRLTPFA